MNNRLTTAVLLIILWAGVNGAKAEYLSTGEVVAIGGGGLTMFGLGVWSNNFDSSKTSLIYGPLPGEKSAQRFLGGQYYTGKSNFLDSRFGSAVTPITGALLLTSMNVAWPSEKKGKGLSQDLFLFISGLLATRGLTDFAKATAARPRPYIEMISEMNSDCSASSFVYDHNSFFSGHTSGAFFISTFLNKRVRTIMRREMNKNEYREWRWLPPTFFYGWSSFVGWSRIHAWKHYISDVVIGALAGWLMGELFYSFNNDGDNSGSRANGQMLFQITLKF